MTLKIRCVGGTQIIQAAMSRIDASEAIQFKDQMRDLTKSDIGRYVLDLTEVDFIDSSGLGAIVGSMKQLSPGQTLELAGLSETVSKVFELTRMNTVFTIHDSAEQAASGSDQ